MSSKLYQTKINDRVILKEELIYKDELIVILYVI